MSDHYSPWLDEQGHSPNAWVTLGAMERVDLMTCVTCPIMRYHPTVVAQQAATVRLLSGNRFTLGLGAGENLNEHVVGRGWPPVNVRHDVDAVKPYWEAGFTHVALVQIGGDHQDAFFAAARACILPALREAAG